MLLSATDFHRAMPVLPPLRLRHRPAAPLRTIRILPPRPPGRARCLHAVKSAFQTSANRGCPMNTEIHQIDRSRIAVYFIFQSRAGINPKVVQDYVELVDDNDHIYPFLDPIVVFEITDFHPEGAEDKLFVVDGFHRIRACDARDVQNLPCIIHKGTKRDAILYSVSANAYHGLKPSDADKRRAACTLLEDEEWRQWSDHQIAKRIGATHPFIAKVRKEMFPDDDRKACLYIDKHGNQTTMNLSKDNSAQTTLELPAQTETEADQTEAAREQEPTISEKDLQKARKAGFSAFGHGRTLKENPYDVEDPRFERWAEGFRAAEKNRMPKAGQASASESQAPVTGNVTSDNDNSSKANIKYRSPFDSSLIWDGVGIKPVWLIELIADYDYELDQLGFDFSIPGSSSLAELDKDAYDAGTYAFRWGRDISENPYSEDATLYIFWFLGFCSAYTSNAEADRAYQAMKSDQVEAETERAAAQGENLTGNVSSDNSEIPADLADLSREQLIVKVLELREDMEALNQENTVFETGCQNALSDLESMEERIQKLEDLEIQVQELQESVSGYRELWFDSVNQLHARRDISGLWEFLGSFFSVKY